MSPTVATNKKALRRELSQSGINDPFEIIADLIQRNEELRNQLDRIVLLQQDRPKGR